MLLMWVWNEIVLSRMTPRLLTWREGQTEELSMGTVKLGVLVRVDLEPMRRTSVLLLFSFRKLEENQVLISCKQSQRRAGRWRWVWKQGRAGCRPHNSGNGY